LTYAAGAAGLIKTVLSLHFREIPPSINFERPNPAIDFEKSPFIVNNTLIPWETHGPRRAGVSSFGVGGTNVHLALEEYVEPPNPAQRHEPGPSLISWSAATEASARMYADRLVGYLADRPNVNLHALAATLS